MSSAYIKKNMSAYIKKHVRLYKKTCPPIKKKEQLHQITEHRKRNLQHKNFIFNQVFKHGEKQK
jgi:hypothetical protein